MLSNDPCVKTRETGRSKIMKTKEVVFNPTLSSLQEVENKILVLDFMIIEYHQR